MEPIKKWLDINGTQQRVWVFMSAEKKAPPLVCLHEGLGCLELWRDFPEKLANWYGGDVILLERLGHGQSGILNGESDVRHFNKEAEVALPCFLDQLGLTKVRLLGHSDGATIALLFAAAYPHRVEKTITLAAHSYRDSSCYNGIIQAMNAFENKGLHEKMQAYHGEAAHGLFYRWAHTWTHPDFDDWNVFESLPNVICPILAIQGENDVYGEKEQLSAIAFRAGGPVETWLVPGCGHNPHLECPLPILDRLRLFLGK